MSAIFRSCASASSSGRTAAINFAPEIPFDLPFAAEAPRKVLDRWMYLWSSVFKTPPSPL